MGLLVYTLSQSIWVSLGLIILFLALIKNIFYNTTESNDSDLMILIKDFIFYIPCLITDSIDFLKKDYMETPSTTFIVFILILVYVAIFFLAPLFNTDGGHLLISGPKNLNSVIRFSTDEILSLDMEIDDSWDVDQSYNDLSYNININEKDTYPVDPITQVYLDEQKTTTYVNEWGFNKKMKNTEGFEGFTEGFEEGFTEGYSSLGLGLVQQDTNYDFRSKSKPSSLDKDYTDFDIVEVYNEISDTATEQINKVNSGFKAFKDLFQFSNPDPRNPYIYNYGLSFWLYINTFHFKKQTVQIQEILSFGKRIAIKYDNMTNDLIILLNDKEVYRSKGILYQRWNHVVVNSNDSKIDLFINNNLVGTYHYPAKDDQKRPVPPVSLYDTLVVGSTKNINFGNICNFRYYNYNIDLSKIKSIYTKYNKKTPPL
jgi:hypothetical protein